MVIWIKQHLGNIWSSIYEKVKQHRVMLQHKQYFSPRFFFFFYIAVLHLMSLLSK